MLERIQLKPAQQLKKPQQMERVQQPKTSQQPLRPNQPKKVKKWLPRVKNIHQGPQGVGVGKGGGFTSVDKRDDNIPRKENLNSF